MSGAEGKFGLNYRRRVIYRALQETFRDPQIVRSYFERWQRDHSDEAHFVVTRFAAAVTKEAGFDAQQKSQFQRRLFQGLIQPYETLPRVPDDWIVDTGAADVASDEVAPIKTAPVEPRSAPSPASPSAPAAREPASESVVFAATSPERAVFTAFAQRISTAILAKVDRHPGVLRQAVADLPAGEETHERALSPHFGLWAETRFRADALPPLRHPEELRYFAHQLYLLAADLIGPVQADRLLAEAAAAAARLPEAASFSPQMLL
jgi:hypothetical protein